MTGNPTPGAADRTEPETPRTDATTVPVPEEIPSPSEVCADRDATGYVVWHRKHLRTDDHLALSRALADADIVCPLFVFDPSFYDDGGLACDARLRFLHEAVGSLDRLYATAPATVAVRSAERSTERVAERTPLCPRRSEERTTAADPVPCAASPGLTFGYGDPVAVLSRFVDSGWNVITMATPTSRYGKRRDERVRAACGDGVSFVSGDGLVRWRERSRRNWQAHVEGWLEAPQHAPGWTDGDGNADALALDAGVTPAVVDRAHGVAPTKTKVPTGTHRVGAERLRSFVGRIRSYPERISAPQDARGGTSGLSPYLNFGLFSVRQAYQSVTDRAPSCRGVEMFTDRLAWNLHYNQKLVDWPGWTDTAVNPVFEGFNEDRHDPELVRAWKRGRTGFPMVDASMRCLSATGWLNFRMRAMCASVFAHVLQQPWWIGADWYHHHLIDSDVGINYTQWQSQAGLIGKPAQRVYNPRKQVRDQDPDGEWITEWVPELEALPSRFLDRPERTPRSVQEDCGVRIGEDYPRPVVNFDARRESFWLRYERRRPAAARALARPDIAERASFSGGYGAAKAIAAKHGGDPETASDVQVSLSDALGAERHSGESTPSPPTAPTDGEGSPGRSLGPDTTARGDDPAPETTRPTGAGNRAGEPSPDDRAAASGRGADAADGPSDGGGTDEGNAADGDDEQTTIGGFE
ncbi:cryptochrome/deoxyribodipyrimidine photo-lyase family protein [Natronomonas sp.]|uniref:cryptochrome/deoxyribodipyrimidine photo-lyase family protein n=1 Tax=Natronomonas sp. TaxID=2184060 RepID=UPI00261CE708|nr:FAD-binding domain-containing protein [Natronomonas sp.]